MLELENALGGDPGPGLGADSDFDKRQLEKVKLSWLAVIRHQTEIIILMMDLVYMFLRVICPENNSF